MADQSLGLVCPGLAEFSTLILSPKRVDSPSAASKQWYGCCCCCCCCCCCRFVDGASYMAAVADALEAAREEIFITDWMWVSFAVVSAYILFSSGLRELAYREFDARSQLLNEGRGSFFVVGVSVWVYSVLWRCWLSDKNQCHLAQNVLFSNKRIPLFQW